MLYVEFNTNLRRLFILLAILVAAIITVKSLTPAIPTLSITNIDKVAHMLAYLTLGMVALPAFARVRPFFVWVGLCVFGASIEITQGLLNTGRSADVLDGIANAIGALLAIACWVLLSKFARNFT